MAYPSVMLVRHARHSHFAPFSLIVNRPPSFLIGRPVGFLILLFILISATDVRRTSLRSSLGILDLHEYSTDHSALNRAQPRQHPISHGLLSASHCCGVPAASPVLVSGLIVAVFWCLKNRKPAMGNQCHPAAIELRATDQTWQFWQCLHLKFAGRRQQT